MMINSDSKKLTELVLYILEKTGGVDFYHTFKILYFAEMKHLAKWGISIVPDKFCALKYGPVPTHLYDAIKELNYPRMMLSEELSEVIQFAGEDAPNVLIGKRCPDLKLLSRSEIEALDQSICENGALPFSVLMEKSHDDAWAEAHNRVNGTNVISPVAMARVLHADEAIIEYLEEQMLIDSALK